jgi:hypothetical protein
MRHEVNIGLLVEPSSANNEFPCKNGSSAQRPGVLQMRYAARSGLSVQLGLEPLHGAVGQADQLGRAVDANPLTERPARLLDGVGIIERAAKRLAGGHGPFETGMDSSLDHVALEFGKCAGHLQHQLARGCGGVDRLLIEVQVNPDRLKRLDGIEQVNQRAAHAIDRPGHDYVELQALGPFEQVIEAGPILPGLGAADPQVAEGLDDLPTARFGHLGQCRNLILDGLAIG